MSHPGSAGPQPGVTQKPHDPEPKGWYSRGYLPHFDSIYALQSITFRLADSIPQEKLRQLENALKHRPTSVKIANGDPMTIASTDRPSIANGARRSSNGWTREWAVAL